MLNNAALVTQAAKALDRYRSQERELEREIDRLQSRLDTVREFLDALSPTQPTEEPIAA